MKKYNYFLSLMIIGIMASCRDKNPVVPEPEKQYAQFKFGDSLWTAMNVRAYRWDQNLIGLMINKTIVQNGQTYPWDGLNVGNLKNTFSKQRIYQQGWITDTSILRPRAYFVTHYDHYDVSCDLYNVFEEDSVNNWIQITEEENDYQKIKGKFSITMYRQYSCAESTMPDTIRIRDGEFYAEIY